MKYQHCRLSEVMCTVKFSHDSAISSIAAFLGAITILLIVRTPLRWIFKLPRLLTLWCCVQNFGFCCTQWKTVLSKQRAQCVNKELGNVFLLFPFPIHRVWPQLTNGTDWFLMWCGAHTLNVHTNEIYMYTHTHTHTLNITLIFVTHKEDFLNS